MRRFFNALTTLSLRFRLVTLLMVFVVMGFGVTAVSSMNQELLPPVEFPQTIILAQVTGMTSDQVLTTVTERLEAEISSIPQVVNLESTTTGAFGGVITARNDFGVNQDALRRDVQAALDRVWLPQRRVETPEGENPTDFSARLLADLTPDLLIYLHEQDPNFLFQLSPDVWSALTDETVRTVFAYLAAQVDESDASGNALRQLVDQEITPQLIALPIVARVESGGGQLLPGEPAPDVRMNNEEVAVQSLLLNLPPRAWAAAASKAGVGAQDESAIEALSDVAFDIPQRPPALPESWQGDSRFKDASDLLEIRTLTVNLATVLNRFHTDGRIIGALGRTDDLTPEIVQTLLEIEPTLIEYLEAEQLVALPDEVFAVLPAEYIAGLDAFTRDALAAKAIAQSITGENPNPDPVLLPSQWRIAPPQIIAFSLNDLPLATFSVSTRNSVPQTALDETPDTAASAVDNTASAADATVSDIPEGPALPQFFSLLGAAFNTELDTADDLLKLSASPTLQQQFGGAEVSAAQILNFIPLLADPASLPPGAPQIPSFIRIDPSAIVGGLSAEAVAFMVEYDPGFVAQLSPDLFNYFSDAVLAQPEIAPPLADDWNTLAQQPQFRERPLRNSADLLALGGAASALNTLNASIPADFAGYEVRLFNSLTSANLRYFALHDAGFYTEIDPAVLVKLSPEALDAIPAEVVDALPAETAATLRAIISGEAPSAFETLRDQYATDVPPADPDAPALTADWQFIGDFIGVELDTADDLSRFFPNPVNFLNSFFDSAQGGSFAPNLFGGLSPEALRYMVEQTPAIADGLRVEALQLLQPETLAVLPASVQERAETGGTPFNPTDRVTRSNGSSSLLLTIYKVGDANTVSSFHQVEGIIEEIQQENPDLQFTVVSEQASFIEESIDGVAREGGLGALFAIIVILVFLSGGHWQRSGRRIVGILMIVICAALLGLITLQGGEFVDSEFGVISRFLLIVGMVVGVGVLLFPGNLPYPAWRATLVIAVSIPLSVLTALAMMYYFVPAVHNALLPAAAGSPLLQFILRLFPESLTLNIMTLSGLTVAIGRVVDDSIVVLENIFRQMQTGMSKREAIISGTRDVSVAIFVATMVTVVVFLPLGMTGGIIGEFFLPFGLAVTYSLLASFVVAVTVVPVLTYLFITVDDEIAGEEGGRSFLERLYLPVLRWSLSGAGSKVIVLVVAFASMLFGFVLFGQRPQTFLPEFGQPQISVSIDMPAGTRILETNERVKAFEEYIQTAIPPEQIESVQTNIGGGGMDLASFLGGGGGVNEAQASVVIVLNTGPDERDALAGTIRDEAEMIFGEEHVLVSAASLSEQGFGGFELVLSGPQADIQAVDPRVVAALESVPGITNVSSNLSQVGGASGADTPTAYIRIDGQSAVRYTAELETDNTIGVTQDAITKIEALPDLPETIRVSQGFSTETQIQGFQSLFVAMGIALVLMVIILVFTFSSPVYWLAIILSVIVAPVGAAILLTTTERVLGISALIGLLMLLGIVVTNAVVLIDRVHTNNVTRKMPLHDALIEAGDRRLRPILMTALATIGALSPLAIGLSKGAIIASELGTVVIGGLFSSTVLTLIVVPVAYDMLHPVHRFLTRILPSRRAASAEVVPHSGSAD